MERNYKMLIDREKAQVVVINMQLELVPLLENGTSVLNDCCWLADVAESLDLPTMVVEHMKLGKLSEALKEVAGRASYVEKYYFDLSQHETIERKLSSTGRNQIILAGAETHVCLLQSAIGLSARGGQVFVVRDACSSRNRADHEAGLERLHAAGVTLVTKEMLFFEMIRNSEFPGYIDLAMKFLDGRYIR
jgi:Isochorismatase family